MSQKSGKIDDSQDHMEMTVEKQQPSGSQSYTTAQAERVNLQVGFSIRYCSGPDHLLELAA